MSNADLSATGVALIETGVTPNIYNINMDNKKNCPQRFLRKFLKIIQVWRYFQGRKKVPKTLDSEIRRTLITPKIIFPSETLDCNKSTSEAGYCLSMTMSPLCKNQTLVHNSVQIQQVNYVILGFRLLRGANRSTSEIFLQVILDRPLPNKFEVFAPVIRFYGTSPN
jgi:hypothetical protein